ncbi:MAG TPA: hypothetical protein VM008_14960 [Phycisphaerae bacterium]|nr:hypothetical protein [Phycisphaerae bacterium]
MTTKALQSLIDKATALSPDLQERFAQQWLAELEDEQLWDEKFAGSQDLLEKMAKDALENFRAGKTLEKGWDEI